MSTAPSANKPATVANVLMKHAIDEFKRLVTPSLVPIYAHHERRLDTPIQTGTGFLVEHQSRCVLITARHTLRGHDFREPPGDRAVHVNGQWVYIGDNGRQVVEPKDRDLTMTYMDEFAGRQCLSSYHLYL